MNLNSVAEKCQEFHIKGEKLCQESLQDPTLFQLLLRLKCVPNHNPESYKWCWEPISTEMNGACILLFFGGQHELFQPEVAWSGAAEYQRLSDGGDVRHPYARCYREAMKVTMHVNFCEESSWH